MSLVTDFLTVEAKMKEMCERLLKPVKKNAFGR